MRLAVKILYAVAFLLVMFNLVVAILAGKNPEFVGLVEVSLWLTGAFAVVGTIFGLVYGPRIARTSRQSGRDGPEVAFGTSRKRF